MINKQQKDGIFINRKYCYEQIRQLSKDMDMKRAECIITRESIQEIKNLHTELENTTLFFLHI